jgi:homoserine dehydrogenase
VRALADDGHIVSLSGVLNGTCNYILDRIAAGCSWEQAVAEAQERGFAERDPSADLSGADTICKLQLLARRAFPQTDGHYISSTGIDAIDTGWVQKAARDGGRARLIGTAQLVDGRVHLEVKPQLVDASHPFAQIRNEENCLLINTGHADLQHVWTGRGAGRWPTTAAVMADLFDLSRERRATSPENIIGSARADGMRRRHETSAVQLTTGHWQLATDQGGAA